MTNLSLRTAMVGQCSLSIVFFIRSTMSCVAVAVAMHTGTSHKLPTSRLTFRYCGRNVSPLCQYMVRSYSCLQHKKSNLGHTILAGNVPHPEQGHRSDACIFPTPQSTLVWWPTLGSRRSQRNPHLIFLKKNIIPLIKMSCNKIWDNYYFYLAYGLLPTRHQPQVQPPRWIFCGPSGHGR